MATNAFQFGFEGDDIEEDLEEKVPLSSVPANSRADEELPQNDPKMHFLGDLVCESFEKFFFILLYLIHRFFLNWILSIYIFYIAEFYIDCPVFTFSNIHFVVTTS